MYTWCSRSAVIQAEKTKDITRTRIKSQVHVSVKKINGIKREPNLLLIHLGPKNMATIIVYHTLVAQKKSPPPAQRPPPWPAHPLSAQSSPPPLSDLSAPIPPPSTLQPRKATEQSCIVC